MLEPGEDPLSERAIDAAGPWWTVSYHGLWAAAGEEAVRNIPGGDAWLDQIANDRPEGQHHLAVHEGHCTHITPRDKILIDAAGDNLEWNGWVGTPERLREYVAEAGARGTTEIIYNTAGKDPLREIKAFAEATIG